MKWGYLCSDFFWTNFTSYLKWHNLQSPQILVFFIEWTFYKSEFYILGHRSQYHVWLQMCVWLQIQGSRVWSQPWPILLWRLIMKQLLLSSSFLPLNHSKRFIVSYKRKYLHNLLVNRLFKLTQEQVWLGELTVLSWPYIAVAWDIKQQNRQTNKQMKQL